MPLILTGTSSTTTLDSSAGLTFSDSSNQSAAASPFGLKNRIINGDMVISQRNGTSSVTPTGAAYTLDRWLVTITQASKFSVQQNAGSVTPPAGFTNYLGITSTSAYSVLTGDTFLLEQLIEGYNVADLNFGLSSAQTITASFWVRSSLTGTFGGSLSNDIGNRVYAFNYTISSANTWEQKSVTIPGDTTGTWLTTNGIGMRLRFGLGSGSTFSGTAGVWGTVNAVQPTGSVSVVGTNGATFYITGVQLERNTTATPFEWIPYGTELALCQRYYWTGNIYGLAGYGDITNLALFGVNLPVTMRAQPSVTNASDSSGIVANGSLYNTTASTATILNSWFSGHNMAVAVTVNAQITRWTTCYGRILSFQANAEL